MEVTIISIICTVWIIATIIIQFDNKLSKAVLVFDVLSLLPRWTFFAPVPSSTDVHLLLRFEKNGENSSWHETNLTIAILKRPKYTRWIFNPYRRIEKLLFDFTNETFHLKDSISQIIYLTDYILILRFCEKLAFIQSANKVQFMIAGSNATLYKDLEIFFISDSHDIS